VIGQNPRILKSGETSPEEYRRLWEALEAGKQWKGEFHNRRKDGSLYWEEATIGPIVNTDGTFDHYLAVKTDITERKQAASVQDSIYKISEISSSSESLPELFGGIHMVVDEIMNTSNFYIALVNQKTNMLEFPYFVDERDPRPVPRPLGMGLTEYVIRTGAPLLASPLVQKRLYDSGEVELVGTPSTDWLGVPLKIGHAVMGALVVQSYKAQVRFGMPELTMLNYISDNIAIAIQRKSAEDEKNRLLAELKESLVNIKTLKGLVPICSSCKKIRNDFGYWQQVEEYVAEHTEADFSHGLCDECAHKLYPQYFRKLKNKTAGDEIG
jgi:GAF domain-containing protein